jgi:hypothetical protein
MNEYSEVNHESSSSSSVRAAKLHGLSRHSSSNSAGGDNSSSVSAG